MEYPANALVVNGVVIGILEGTSAQDLIQMSVNGKFPAVQVAALEIPLRRGDDELDVQHINERSKIETPVSKREVKLTLEFTRRGEDRFVVER